MKLIVGLGNSGTKYKLTRHNAGYMLIERLFKHNHDGLVLATTANSTTDAHMNNSGLFVKKILDETSFTLDDLYVAHDDLDLPLGEFKIQFGKGPKIHNGINSVEEELGTKDFWRIRIGIDNRQPENRTEGETYVLEDFSADEIEILEKVLDKVSHELKMFLQKTY